MLKFKLAAIALSLMLAANAHADSNTSSSDGKPKTPTVPAFVPTTYTYDFSATSATGILLNYASLTINNSTATTSGYTLTLDSNFGSLFDVTTYKTTTTTTYVDTQVPKLNEDGKQVMVHGVAQFKTIQTPVVTSVQTPVITPSYVSAVDINYAGTAVPNISSISVTPQGGVSKVTDTTQKLIAPFDLSYILGNSAHIGFANQLVSGETITWTTNTATTGNAGSGEDGKKVILSNPLKIDGISLVINGTVRAGVLEHVVSAVPEPETYGMMLMGLGLMGFIARRRRNDQA